MTNKVRTTIVLPEETALKLRASVPARKRSEFVTEAIEYQLMKLRSQTERERSFGVWRDEDYPNLHTQEDMRRHIAQLRDDRYWRSPTDCGSS